MIEIAFFMREKKRQLQLCRFSFPIYTHLGLLYAFWNSFYNQSSTKLLYLTIFGATIAVSAH